MDIGRAFTFAFEDPDWLKKLLIGGLLLFIPFFGWLVVGGYWMRIIRRTYEGNDVPLPEWDQLGEDFVLGLKGAVALFVWWLPFIAIFLTMMCLSLPFWLAGNTSNEPYLVPFTALSVFGWIGLSGLSILFQIVMLVIQPMVIGRIAVTTEISSGFEVHAIAQEIRRVPVSLLIIVGLEYGLRSVSGFGILLCIVGVLFTTFAAYVPLSHLYGQLRRELDGSDTVPTELTLPA